MYRILFAVLAVFSSTAFASNPANPILYVTQVPMPDEINNRTAALTRLSAASSIQNPMGDTRSAGRGGALMLRMPNGSVRNLTKEAGFGVGAGTTGNVAGSQNGSGIAVQHPFVNWDATRAIFSMAVGAPASAADTTIFYWQLYEVTNLAQVLAGTAAQIALVPNQPATYNNLHACYGTNARIIFTSDRPRAGLTYHYPQLDEYLLQPINTGLWSIDPSVAGGDLKHIVHAPSGIFQPFVDHSGRLLFIQWDHLSRDVEAVTDRTPIPANGDNWTQTFNGTGNFASEAAGAAFTPGTDATYAAQNTYPEPRPSDRTSLLGTNMNGNAFNQFFLWQAFEDGSGHEIINHSGRHEFLPSFLRSFTGPNDTALVDFNVTSTTPVRTSLNQILAAAESPTNPGTFYCVDGVDVGTHNAGVISSFSLPPGANPDTMAINYISVRPAGFLPPPPIPPALPTGNAQLVFRNPLPLANGTLIASYASVKCLDGNTSTSANTPGSYYNFRLAQMSGTAPTMTAGTLLTSGATATNVTYFMTPTLGSPLQITYNGPLWELDPVEVIARTKPSTQINSVASVEQTVFAEEGVDIPTFSSRLAAQNQALVVARDATHRDRADKQQPFNLKVAWSSTQTLSSSYVAGQTIYDIGWLQIMQSDALRGLTMGTGSTVPGRRVLAVPLHDTISANPPTAGAPPGAVKLGNDGSFAVIVPSNRAVTWHLLDGAGTKSQIKERYWVNFASGEIRTCAVCHGLNTNDQANNVGAPTNKPEALRTLLQFWKSNNPPGSMQHAAPAASFVKDAGPAALSVTRVGGNVGPVSVQYVTADGSALAGVDYASASGTLTWNDGDTSSKPIAIQSLNNPIIGASKSLTVNLSAPINGTLGATVTATVSLDEPPFNAWLFSHFGANANDPIIGGFNADPDGDGLTNLEEYFFGTIPVAHPDLAPVVAREDIGGSAFLTLTFTRDLTRTDLSYTAQSSPNLAAWNAVGDVLVSTSGNLETHKASLPLSGSEKFLRLKITRL